MNPAFILEESGFLCALCHICKVCAEVLDSIPTMPAKARTDTWIFASGTECITCK